VRSSAAPTSVFVVVASVRGTSSEPVAVLAVNAGSHSLKLALVVPGDGPAGLDIDEQADIDAAPDSDEASDALAAFLARMPEVAAVGNRIVHGGPHLDRHCRVDDAALHALRSAAALAPQHVPAALAAVDLCRRHLPDVAHVACLDTVFHRDLPQAARTYPVPREWRETYGVRRYRFHGLSYAWQLNRTARLLDRDPADLQVVLTHLGGGASVCAVRDGHSVSTSMGFTPLEGLVMSRRSGSVDPGMLLWLQTEYGLTTAQVSDALEHHSGLFGLSDERSGDTRELVNAARDGNTAARLAMDVFCLRVAQETAAAATSLDRLDALVFSGEIGADQPEVRERVAERLIVLGIRPGLNLKQDVDQLIGATGIPVLLIHPDEQRQIAREVQHVLAASSRRASRFSSPSNRADTAAPSA
jgi:acetate kinase